MTRTQRIGSLAAAIRTHALPAACAFGGTAGTLLWSNAAFLVCLGAVLVAEASNLRLRRPGASREGRDGRLHALRAPARRPV